MNYSALIDRIIQLEEIVHRMLVALGRVHETAAADAATIAPKNAIPVDGTVQPEGEPLPD